MYAFRYSTIRFSTPVHHYSPARKQINKLKILLSLMFHFQPVYHVLVHSNGRTYIRRLSFQTLGNAESPVTRLPYASDLGLPTPPTNFVWTPRLPDPYSIRISSHRFKHHTELPEFLKIQPYYVLDATRLQASTVNRPHITLYCSSAVISSFHSYVHIYLLYLASIHIWNLRSVAPFMQHSLPISRYMLCSKFYNFAHRLLYLGCLLKTWLSYF